MKVVKALSIFLLFCGSTYAVELCVAPTPPSAFTIPTDGGAFSCGYWKVFSHFTLSGISSLAVIGGSAHLVGRTAFADIVSTPASTSRPHNQSICRSSMP